MRTTLLIALALAGCYRDSTPATPPPPSNKQAPPTQALEAADELAFLPKESELVVGIDLEALRTSAAWRDQIEPAVTNASWFEQTHKLCGFDPFAPMTHISIAGRKNGSDTDLIGVLAGGDAKQQLACALKQLSTEYTARADGDVMILTKQNVGQPLALAPVGRSHVIALATQGADANRVHAQLTIGSPLRSSPYFMKLYEKLERGASVWYVVNGNSPLFQSFSLGVQPRYIDGTIVVTDRYVWTTRITMSSPADATQLATMFRGVAAQVRQMVETLDIREEGEVLHVDVVMTQPQVQTILAMLGTII
jgi:hypothetical protein